MIGLIAIGVGSILVYKQREEVRAFEFEGYGISAIEDRVEGIFNDDKTGIRKDISTELTDLRIVFTELKERNLSNSNRNRIEKIEANYFTAQEMYELQKQISNLFETNEVVHNKTTIEKN